MQTRAIVIKRQPTREFDQLVTCYSQDFGKLTAVAKSSLKIDSIQGRHLDTFNVVTFDLITGRSGPIITGAQCEQSYSQLKASLAKTGAGAFFLEVINRVAYEQQRDEKLWNFLLETLNELEHLDHHALESWFRSRQREFLTVLGYTAEQPDERSLDSHFEYTFGVQFTSTRFLAQFI